MDLDITPLGSLHTAISFIAIIAGGVVMASRKGDARHKQWGRYYLWSAMAVNVSGLAIYRHGGFGIFHWMGVGTLLCLGVAVLIVRSRRPAGSWRRWHMTAMMTSYLMLFGGGLHQGLARIHGISASLIEQSLLAVCLAFLMFMIYFWLTVTERRDSRR